MTSDESKRSWPPGWLLRLIACLAVGAALGWLWRTRGLTDGSVDAGSAGTIDDPAVTEKMPTTGPEKSLDPGQVVALQLRALQLAEDHPQAFTVCFAFASPKNRKITGPLDKFIRVVRSPEYAQLIGHDRALIGAPVVRGDQAVVLATIETPEGAPVAYQFILEQQTTPPCQGCWMTSSVVPIRMGGQTEMPRRETDGEAPDE